MLRHVLLLLSVLHRALCLETQPQCQCVTPPTGARQTCLPYDSRFQAVTLEEAMISFPDLTLNQDEPGLSTTIEEEMTCQTKECLDCLKAMRKKLSEIGLMPAAIDTALQDKSTCTKYRFAREEAGGYVKKKDKSSSSSEEYERKKKKMERKQKKHHRDRSKRQAPLASGNVIGERFVLSCTSKGMTTDVTGTVSLCSSCWMWRRLPSNYSPQYINELVCDTSDNSCLSGYASCEVSHRAIEAVRNDSGVMTTVALTAGSYCECRVAANSVIESLVTGAGLSSSLPPLVSSNSTSSTPSN